MPDPGLPVADFVGLPYLKGGRGPDAYDCYGLCLAVCNRFGVIIPEIPSPTTRTDRNDLFASTKDIWTKLSKPKPYCLVAFRIRRNWHAGVVLEDLQSFIHITRGIRVTISQLNSFKWRQQFDGFYEFPDS